MSTPQDSDDKAAGDGCVARLVRCSSFVDLLPVFAGWVILLVTLALMLVGVGQFFGWWDIDMRRHWMTPPTKSPKAQMIVPIDTNQNASLAETISSLACLPYSISSVVGVKLPPSTVWSSSKMSSTPNRMILRVAIAPPSKVTIPPNRLNHVQSEERQLMSIDPAIAANPRETINGVFVRSDLIGSSNSSTNTTTQATQPE